MSWLAAWNIVKSISKKCWEDIKKLPHWALIGFFTLIALVWWILQRYLSAQRKLLVSRSQIKLEKKFSDEISKIGNKNVKEKQALRREFKRETKELNNVKKDIDMASKKGPVGIANAWADYLKGKK
jgi:type VI protein secretion system component VasK